MPSFVSRLNQPADPLVIGFLMGILPGLAETGIYGLKGAENLVYQSVHGILGRHGYGFLD